MTRRLMRRLGKARRCDVRTRFPSSDRCAVIAAAVRIAAVKECAVKEHAVNEYAVKEHAVNEYGVHAGDGRTGSFFCKADSGMTKRMWGQRCRNRDGYRSALWWSASRWSAVVLGISLFVLVAGVGRTAPGSERSAPNVVVFLADDAGWGDFSHNGNKQVQTPNIDSLAKGG